MITALLLSVLPALAPLPQAEAVPRQSSPEAQLSHAKKVKSAARGTQGAARVEALGQAIEAFDAVRQYWPDAGPITAEAAFRRGEIHRSLGQSGKARGAFQEAFDAGAHTAYAPRARLELGHLSRRAGDYPAALKEYAAVHELPGVELRYRNDAREWAGKVNLDLQNWEAAASSLAEWAKNAEGPVEVVRAVDLEARAWIGAGRLDLAESRIKEVQSRMADLANEPTKEAAALQKALERMRSPDLLREARERAETATPVADAASEGA